MDSCSVYTLEKDAAIKGGEGVHSQGLQAGFEHIIQHNNHSVIELLVSQACSQIRLD